MATGIEGLDGGMPLLGGRFHLVGGVRLMGKSTFSISVVLGAAQRGARVVLASPATPPFETKLRLAGALAGVDRMFEEIGWLNEEEDQRFQEGLEALKTLPIQLLEEPLLGFDELHQALRPAGQCDFLVIDDLHAMADVEDHDRGSCLRWLARWLRIPVLATIELPMPHRPNPFPVLWDFPRDLVRAADVTMAIHRPAYFEGVDYSVGEREQWAKLQEVRGAVLWDRTGTQRFFRMSRITKEGPVFV